MTSKIVLLVALSVLACVSARQNFDCQVFELDTQFVNPAADEHRPKWHCFPEPETSGELYELEESSIPEEILNFVQGGGKWVHIDGPFVNPAGKVPPGAAISIAAREKNGGGGGLRAYNPQTNDRTAPSGELRYKATTGQLTVLVVRATFADSSPTSNAAKISDSVFGTGGDPVNLVSQYAACSKGQTNFVPATKAGSPIVDGVLDVSVNTIIAGKDRAVAQGEAADEAVAILGSLSGYDHVMYCLPPGTAGSWIAYGYYNNQRTIYNDLWCEYPSAQMHEIGHNLYLKHSNEGTESYGDQTGLMGYSYSSDDWPRMCFNPAKSYQLGWYSDCVTAITTPLTTTTQRNLVGTADYTLGSCPEGDAVVLRVSTGGANVQDLYVGYNKRTGMNIETREYWDMVTIILGGESTASTFPQESNLQAALAVGQSFSFGSILIKYCATENGKAVVGVSGGEDPCAPPPPACTSDADCADAVFCNGAEVCVAGNCAAGSAPCGGSTPVCSEASDTCVQCAASTDCSGSTPVCAGNVCVECDSDATCDDGTFCNGAETCVGGSCTASAAPCAGQVCSEASDTCVQCLASTDCGGSTPVCSATNVCVECATAADCDDGAFCNGAETCNAAGSCVSAAAPCAAALCSEASDVCFECVANSDCGGSTPVCAGNVCVECATAADCDDGAFCNGAETCNAAGSCAAGSAPCGGSTPVCSEASDACVQCAASTDCPFESPVCAGNVCVGCVTDADCSDSLFCNGAEVCTGGSCAAGSAPCGGSTPVCKEGSDTCVQCETDATCDDGAFCNGAETCNAAGSCVSAAAPCAAALCSEASDVCFECVANSDCGGSTPVCAGNVCVECATTADCSNDDLFCNGAETCVGGSCTASAAPCAGQVCSEASDTCVQCLASTDCGGSTPVCSATNVCVECATAADCDDGAFCNGAETCNSGTCAAGTPVACSDGNFCNGVETCDENADACTAGSAPCTGITPFCSEAANTCLECETDAHCDDGAFCNGAETCNSGTCAAGTPVACSDGNFCNGVETCDENADACTAGSAPCTGSTPFCSEAANTCLECETDAHCDDGSFCNGAETCNAAGSCVSAAAPCSASLCDEASDVCNEPPPCTGDVDESNFPGCCCDTSCSKYVGRGGSVLKECCVDGVRQSSGFSCLANADQAKNKNFLVGADEEDNSSIVTGSEAGDVPMLAVLLGVGGFVVALAAIVLAVRVRSHRRREAEQQMIADIQMAPSALKTELAFEMGDDGTQARREQFQSDVEAGARAGTPKNSGRTPKGGRTPKADGTFERAGSQIWLLNSDETIDSTRRASAVVIQP